MTIAFIQLHAREKDVATLSVCIRVKKPMAQKKSHPFTNQPVESGKKLVKTGSNPVKTSRYWKIEPDQFHQFF
jgi:hypothetical protein